MHGQQNVRISDVIYEVKENAFCGDHVRPSICGLV